MNKKELRKEVLRLGKENAYLSSRKDCLKRELSNVRYQLKLLTDEKGIKIRMDSDIRIRNSFLESEVTKLKDRLDSKETTIDVLSSIICRHGRKK